LVEARVLERVGDGLAQQLFDLVQPADHVVGHADVLRGDHVLDQRLLAALQWEGKDLLLRPGERLAEARRGDFDGRGERGVHGPQRQLQLLASPSPRFLCIGWLALTAVQEIHQIAPPRSGTLVDFALVHLRHLPE
jgi:hypothetical protein